VREPAPLTGPLHRAQGGNGRRTALAIALTMIICTPVPGQDSMQIAVDPVIHYESSEGLADPIVRLQAQLEAGKRRLKFERRHGYLLSLLEALNIPISSQALVFSKTSSQNEHVSPRTPRAVYFARDVYVGWARDCPVIDLASMDPKLGAVFYTLDQKPSLPARFTRRFDCLQCHKTAKTAYLPGVFVRSTYTGADGTPLATAHGFVSGHNSSLDQR